MNADELEQKVPGSKLMVWGGLFMLLGSLFFSLLLLAGFGWLAYVLLA